MATPIIETIAAAVKTTLEGVTEANGYNQTVAEVVRPTRLGGFALKDLLVVLRQGDWADVSGAPLGKVRRAVPFAADLHRRPSERDTTPIDTLLNTFAADVEKALAADRTVGGRAVFLEIGEPEGFVIAAAEGGAVAYEGVTVNFTVTYQHAANDPFTA